VKWALDITVEHWYTGVRCGGAGTVARGTWPENIIRAWAQYSESLGIVPYSYVQMKFPGNAATPAYAWPIRHTSWTVTVTLMTHGCSRLTNSVIGQCLTVYANIDSAHILANYKQLCNFGENLRPELLFYIEVAVSKITEQVWSISKFSFEFKKCFCLLKISCKIDCNLVTILFYIYTDTILIRTQNSATASNVYLHPLLSLWLQLQ